MSQIAEPVHIDSPIIAIEGVSKGFRSGANPIHALSDTSLGIGKGQVDHGVGRPQGVIQVAVDRLDGRPRGPHEKGQRHDGGGDHRWHAVRAAARRSTATGKRSRQAPWRQPSDVARRD